MPTVHMMIGIPRSGKTTIVNKKWPNLPVVSADRIRKRLHGKPFVEEAETMVWAIREYMLRELLSQGLDIVIDETNTTIERRKKLNELIKQYDYKVIGHIVLTSKEECLKRCDTKELEETIERMHEQFELPELYEGFNSIEHHSGIYD